MPRSASTWFEDAVDVPAWLEADRSTPYPERVRRDREIARGLGMLERPGAAVRGWWQAIGGARPASAGARLEHARRLIGLLTTIVGFLAGVSVALAAFQYDGTHPVNVVRVLALLVVLPLVLLVPSLLLAIPGGGPFRPVQEALAALNLGSLAAALARRVAKAPPELGRLFDWGAARAGAAGRFAKWQMLYWSQLAGTAFAAAALATGVLLVSFTDLAFGWSTTLAVEPPAVSRAVELIAAPWRRFAPGAVPSLELIEQSQYFRFEGRPPAATLPSTLTGWWPFTLLAIATYALLPRLALLVLARIRLGAATRALLLDDPRVRALLDRMREPDVATTSTGPAETPLDEPLAAPTARQHLDGRAQAIVWNDCLAPDAARAYGRRLGVELENVLTAGSGALADDRQALQRLDDGGRSLIVFVPAWEPPILEFLDFLGDVRKQVGDDASIVVTPVAEAGGSVTELERGVWSRAVGRVADPRLYVETGAA